MNIKSRQELLWFVSSFEIPPIPVGPNSNKLCFIFLWFLCISTYSMRRGKYTYMYIYISPTHFIFFFTFYARAIPKEFLRIRVCGEGVLIIPIPPEHPKPHLYCIWIGSGSANDVSFPVSLYISRSFPQRIHSFGPILSACFSFTRFCLL